MSQQRAGLLGSNYDGIILWHCCEAALIFLTVCSLYIFACVVIMIKRSYASFSRPNHVSPGTRKSSYLTVERPISSLSDTNSRATNGQRETNLKSRNRIKQTMNLFCLIASATITVKLLVDQTKFFYAWNARSDHFCELICNVSDVAIFGFVFVAVYGFLWLKQRVFYSNPVVEGLLYTKFITTFSKILVVIILILHGGIAVANFLTVRYKAGNSSVPLGDIAALAKDRSYVGCVSAYAVSDIRQSFPLIAYAVVTGTFQVLLLALFIYPLVRERMDKRQLKKRWEQYEKAKRLSTASSRTRSTDKELPKSSNGSLLDVPRESMKKSGSIAAVGKNSRGSLDPVSRQIQDRAISKKALKSIKRAVIWTTICVVTDVTLVGTFLHGGKGSPQILTTITIDIDLFLNILCIIATYSEWKQILLPFRSYREK